MDTNKEEIIHTVFIEQGIKPNNRFSKYLLGSLMLCMASFVGQIPFTIAVWSKIAAQPHNYSSKELMTVLDPNLSLFLLLISFVFVLFTLFYLIKKLHNQTILSIITAREKIDWARVFFSFFLATIFVSVSVFISYQLAPNDFSIQFQPIPFLILVVIGTILFPFQTSCEEIIFRGYLMQGFGNLAKNRWFPLVMTSLIFGLLHLSNPEVDKMGYSILIYYIGTGFFLGIITLMDEGLELALGFHAANNLIGALLLTSNWSVIQTHAILRETSSTINIFNQIVVPVFIIFPILLLFFSYKYHWSDWKKKLTGNINVTN